MGLFARLHHRNWNNMSYRQRLEDYQLQIKFSLRRLKENYKKGDNVQAELDKLHHYMTSPIWWALKDEDVRLFNKLCGTLGGKIQDEFPKTRNAAANALVKMYHNIERALEQERLDALAQLKAKLGVRHEDMEQSANDLFNKIFEDVLNK